jgi:hypothetical protein
LYLPAVAGAASAVRKEAQGQVQQEQEEAARLAAKFKVGWLSKRMQIMSMATHPAA